MISVGIIIPVYNAEKYLEDCIESIINQTHRCLKVVLVNDGSTDNSKSICEKYSKLDERIILINKENGGAASARNVGINACETDYITFMDSDDFWNSNTCLQDIVRRINNTNPDIVIHDVIKLYDNGKQIYDKNNLDEEYIRTNSAEDVIEYLIKNQKFRTSAYNKVVKREIIIENKIFFKEGIIAEDIDWGMKLTLYVKKYDAYNEKFYMYRQREGSVTKTINEKGIRDLWYVISFWIDEISNLENIKIKDYLMSYLAYHYAILIGLVYSNEELKDSEIIFDVKDYSWIINYAKNKKTKALKSLYKLVGIDLSMFTIDKFLKIKKLLDI